MVRRTDAPRGAADPVASAPRRERPASHLPQRTAPVYRGQRAPTLSTLAPPGLHNRSSRSRPACGKSASPGPSATPPRRFPLDLREQNAVACPSAFIQIRASTARQAAGEAHDDAREGSTEPGGVRKGMQLAAPGIDVHVTSMRGMRAAGGPARRSGLGPHAASYPGADKHTAAGGRVALAGRGALGCGGGCSSWRRGWRARRPARCLGHRRARSMVYGVVCVSPEKTASSPDEGFSSIAPVRYRARAHPSFAPKRPLCLPKLIKQPVPNAASGDERKHTT
jgi:hypothetical protein